MSERPVSNLNKPDVALEMTLRPSLFSDFTGQPKVKERLEIAVAAAKQRGQIQDWIAASSADWTLTVGADHQMFTVTDSSIRGGMLRGTRYNPLNVVRGGKTILVQQPPAGTYVYRYTITSAKGDWTAAKSWRAGIDRKSTRLNSS